MEKLASSCVILTIIIGNEILIKNLVHPLKKSPMKKRTFVKQFEYHLSRVCTPSLIMNFTFSTIIGGLVGFKFLSPDIILFLSTSILFFIITIGMELLLFNKVSIGEILSMTIIALFKSSFIQSLRTSAIAQYSSAGFIIGTLLAYFYYSTLLTDVLFSGFTFLLIGSGLACFKK
ncbi:hypothetical protein DID78_05865 [Candidatus Marinamargulisbacteria bacterium SCGC AG-343-D04]|nr:hypothetical protein DID78_05865 [Candidatus Marinamargulisbacteria bacterium SCGC AG-343-D04]